MWNDFIRLGKIEYKKLIIALLMIIYSSLIFCGCSKETVPEAPVVSQNKMPVEKTEVETVSENSFQCIVDLYGYSNDEEKKVLFNGMQEGQIFWVVDSETSKAVYEGKVSNNNGREVTGIGDFSNVTVSGNYYIYTTECGVSKTFNIGENITNEVASGLYEQFVFDKCGEYESKTMMLALMSYDLNRNNIELVKYLSDTIRNYLEQTEITNEEALPLGIVYAEYYCIGQRDYPDLARKCMANAKQIYQVLEQDESITDSWDWYIFNAWMLRGTGDKVYKEVVEAFIDNEDLLESPEKFIGDYGYLTATRNVEASYGYKLITPIMDTGAAVVDRTKKSPYLTILDEDMENGLMELVKLAYVNYVITNKEYRTVIRDNLHYLFGRNENSINYLTSDDSCLCGEDGLYYKSMLLFVLSNVDFVLDTGRELLD